MSDGEQSRWVTAAPSTAHYYSHYEIFTPTRQAQEASRGRLRWVGWGLAVLGVIATLVIAGPGMVAAVLMQSPTPAVVGAVMVVAVWIVAVLLWRRFVAWHVQRPVAVGRYRGEYRQHLAEQHRRSPRRP